MYGWTSFVGFFFNSWYFLCDSPYRSDSCHKFFDILLLLAGDSWKLKKCWKMRKLTILAIWKLKSRFLKIKKKINAIRADKHVTSTLRMGGGGMDGSFEIGRPRSREWKKFGRRWTKRLGVLKIGQLHGCHPLDVLNIELIASEKHFNRFLL